MKNLHKLFLGIMLISLSWIINLLLPYSETGFLGFFIGATISFIAGVLIGNAWYREGHRSE